MRYSIAFVALAAAVSAQSSYPSGYVNPFTQYLTETDSRGVVTGMPQVNTQANTDVATSQPLAVTTEPAVVTSQPAVATSPAGTPSIIPTLSTKAGSAPVATGSSGNGTTGTNGTVSTGSLKSSGASSTAASSTNSNVGGSGSSSGTATAGSPSGSSTGKSSAGMLEPAFGLGLAGALFAAFL